MFEIRDLFQWDRFITPTIIKVFYWLVIVLIVLSGLSGIFAGLTSMAVSPFSGFITILLNVAGVLVGIVFSRIAAEFDPDRISYQRTSRCYSRSGRDPVVA